MFNIFKVFGPQNLRHIFVQTRYIDPKNKEANEKRCFPIAAVADRLSLIDINITESMLDSLNHPVVNTLGEWHSTGVIPSQLGWSKFAVYPRAYFIDEEGREWSQWLCLDIDLHKHEVDDAPRNSRLDRISTAITMAGLNFCWAWSRSGGIHIYIFFTAPIERKRAESIAYALKEYLFKQGIFNEDEVKRIDVRPAGSGTEQILLPNNHIYPDAILHAAPRKPIADPEDILRNDPDKSIAFMGERSPRTGPKANRPDRPQINIDALPHKLYSPNFPETLTYSQDTKNKDQNKSMESDLPYNTLYPCIRHMLLNEIPIPEGQYNKVSYAVCQNIIAAHPLDDQDDAFGRAVEVMNLIGSFHPDYKDRPPEPAEFFAATYKSAMNGVEKGFCPACGFDGGGNVMREHCNSMACRPYWHNVQQAMGWNKDRVLRFRFMDPSERMDNVAPVIFTSLIIDETLNPYDESNWTKLIVEFKTTELSRFDLFEAAIKSPNKQNVDKYDFEVLIQVGKKDFSSLMNQLINKATTRDLKTMRHEREYTDSLVVHLEKTHSVKPIVTELIAPHPIRCGIVNGRRKLYFSEAYDHSIVNSMLRNLRAKLNLGVSTKEVSEFYGTQRLDRRLYLLSPSNLVYWEIDFEDKIEPLPLTRKMKDFYREQFNQLMGLTPASITPFETALSHHRKPKVEEEKKP